MPVLESDRNHRSVYKLLIESCRVLASMPEVDHWQILIIDDGDYIEFYQHLHTVRGKVTGFVYQLTIRPIDSDLPARKTIRRYDCAHGFAHCDIYNAAGEQIRKEPIAEASIHDASNFALQDILEHVERYVGEYRNSARKRR